MKAGPLNGSSMAEIHAGSECALDAGALKLLCKRVHRFARRSVPDTLSHGSSLDPGVYRAELSRAADSRRSFLGLR